MKPKKPDKRNTRGKKPPRQTVREEQEPSKERANPARGRSTTIKLVRTEVARRVRELALASLPASRRRTTNLFLDHRVIEPGEVLGPKFEPIHIEEPSVLCFADHQPGSNYSHNCQYLLFDPVSGRELRRINARFPPYEMENRGTLRLFHGPVPVEPLPIEVKREVITPCPALPPEGRRFAILFAGVAQWHHVNDLELSYRTLIQYGFDKNDIVVLCHSGVKDKASGLFSDGAGNFRKWPGDKTDFTLELSGPGTAQALKGAIEDVGAKLGPKDMLFIHLDGHGGCDAFPDSDPRRDKGSFLCTWAADNPIGGKYFSIDLEDHLKAIPHAYASLFVLAQQCHGGGFKPNVINVVNAGNTAAKGTIACAAEKSGLSFWSPDHNFNNFSLNWLSAQRRVDLTTGNPLLNDTNGSGAIEAIEAFTYALGKKLYDSPNCACAPNGVDATIALSEPSALTGEWCALVQPLVSSYRKSQPEAQYYEQLHRVLPALSEVILPVLKRHAGEIRKELLPRIERILAEAFGQSPPGPSSKEKKVS